MTLKQTGVRVDYDESGTGLITILEGDDSGIVYKYGKVWIDDRNPDIPSLQFQYEIISGTPLNLDSFVDNIAKLLHTVILEQLESGDVQYTGGTDIKDTDEMGAMFTEFESNKDGPYFSPPGLMEAKPSESAMSFLDRLAAQGTFEIGKMKR